ncbi:unnamed protein product [Medioppia subpectinata]|uniref:Uncharacterized protein n=1 Tax=Medioppia subpectinata TaxID=1979941 RepID=A0A7R9KSI1_9ACAR|nr:unnamed protein product [Medioppia subpectinata]CAG2107809.1 unnamed protein product [Medioppia subpectinata]
MALNANHCWFGANASHDQNSTSNTSNTSHDKPFVHRIQMTTGFVMRSLLVIMVISMTLLVICILRVYCSKGSKGMKTSKDCPKYDSLPTTAINDSLPKNAFVLNDSDDEEISLFDSNHQLIK